MVMQQTRGGNSVLLLGEKYHVDPFLEVGGDASPCDAADTQKESVLLLGEKHHVE